MAGIIVARGAGLSPTYVMEEAIMHYAETNNWWSRFIGEGPNAVIRKITKLEKGAGDTIKVTLFDGLTGEGTDADATLDTNEEGMTPRQDTLYIQQKRHAVKVVGRMSKQRSAVDLYSEAALQLGVWAKNWFSRSMSVQMAGRRGTRTMPIIPLTFAGFGGNTLAVPDSSHTLWAGSAATSAGIAATDIMSTAGIIMMDRQINLLINAGYPMQFPMKNGEEVRSLKITPEQWYDLQNDPDWLEAQSNAGPRDKSNVLFTGSKGSYRGYDVFVDQAGVLFAAASTASVACAQVLGCQAGAIAFGGVEDATEGGGGKWAAEKETKDYGNQTGFSVRTIVGFDKIQTDNSVDLGVFTFNTGYTP